MEVENGRVLMDCTIDVERSHGRLSTHEENGDRVLAQGLGARFMTVRMRQMVETEPGKITIHDYAWKVSEN